MQFQADFSSKSGPQKAKFRLTGRTRLIKKFYLLEKTATEGAGWHTHIFTVEKVTNNTDSGGTSKYPITETVIGYFVVHLTNKLQKILLNYL